MIAKTEAITIRISPFGGTSQIVTWLTADFGKISTTIKGAQRPNRVGGGQYDIGYLCELLFYEREINGLHTFKDCTAIETRTNIRGNWQKTGVLSYLCLLATCSSLPSEKSPKLYRHMYTALQTLESSALLLFLVLWFELQLLSLHGTAPQLQHCTVCRKSLDPPFLVAPKTGGLICIPCNKDRRLETFALSTEDLRILQALQRIEKPLPPTHTYTQLPPSEQCIAMIGQFTSLWLDIAPHARHIAIQMTDMQIASHKRSSHT